MNAIDLTLLAIGSSNRALQPVQLQKALFLLAEKAPPEALPASSRYQFKAYDYGPFSAEIYVDAEKLESEGLVTIVRPPISRYKEYSLTELGRSRATQVRAEAGESVSNYLERAVAYTQSLSFNDLVSSIYTAFPEMKANSIFKN